MPARAHCCGCISPRGRPAPLSASTQSASRPPYRQPTPCSHHCQCSPRAQHLDVGRRIRSAAQAVAGRPAPLSASTQNTSRHPYRRPTPCSHHCQYSPRAQHLDVGRRVRSAAHKTSAGRPAPLSAARRVLADIPTADQRRALIAASARSQHLDVNPRIRSATQAVAGSIRSAAQAVAGSIRSHIAPGFRDRGQHWAADLRGGCFVAACRTAAQRTRRLVIAALLMTSASAQATAAAGAQSAPDSERRSYRHTVNAASAFAAAGSDGAVSAAATSPVRVPSKHARPARFRATARAAQTPSATDVLRTAAEAHDAAAAEAAEAAEASEAAEAAETAGSRGAPGRAPDCAAALRRLREHDAPIRKVHRDQALAGRRVHSQGGQDAIIRDIFALIGTANRRSVEFGLGYLQPRPPRSAEDLLSQPGTHPNTGRLYVEGWNTTFFDTEVEYPRINARRATLTPANIVRHFFEAGVPTDVDYVSIDVDSVDAWLLHALLDGGYRPRVFSVEHNANFGPLQLLSHTSAWHAWTGRGVYGASAATIHWIGSMFGYTLVTMMKHLDVFFVRNDVLQASCGGTHLVAPSFLEEATRISLPRPNIHPPCTASDAARLVDFPLALMGDEAAAKVAAMAQVQLMLRHGGGERPFCNLSEGHEQNPRPAFIPVELWDV